MGDLTLPSLPPDFVPNFLTQPNPINNDTNFPDVSDCLPLLHLDDQSREDRFPKDDDGLPTFVDELHDTIKNLAQSSDQQYTLSREQWIESAALYAQAIIKGFTHYTRGMGAISFKHDLPLESRAHLTELAKNIEMLNRYFQIPYDENTSTNYCHKCLTAEGTTPLHWKTQLEICGNNTSAARDSITNQYIQGLLTQMNLWYESQRAAVHDQIVLKITNENFAPEFLTADPRIIEWGNRVAEDARLQTLHSIDSEAKKHAEDSYQTTLAQYELSHENDLANMRDDYQHSFLWIKNEYSEKLAEAEAQFQKEYQEMIASSKANKPIITDPTARKKRRGSVSTINSPIVTKSQPVHMPVSTNPDPITAPSPKPNPPTILDPIPTTLDPMMQIMNMMNKQFEKLTDRLDRLEANNVNEYSTWDNNPSTWRQPENDLALADSKFEDPYIANMDYDNAQLYDDPPNDHSFVGETEPLVAEPRSQPDSDCILLSGPPTPTAANPKPPTSGLRPPERAQRVDFDSGKLATDSFEIPVGGRCNADGSISYSNAKPPRNNKPKKPFALPEHVTPYSPDQLVLFNKDDIIAHALFAFQHHIPRRLTKPQVIQQYNIAVANSRKPGVRQTTLSFAAAAAKPSHPTQKPRQTTPSAWSKSLSPPPRQPTQPRNNTTWVIHPRMGTSGLTTRPFEGNADKLTEWYRQCLQANAGPNKPALTLLRRAWANGPKSIFSLTFAGHITLQTVRAYTVLFLEQFDNEHIFHPGNNALKKIALFDIPIKRDNYGNPQTCCQLFDKLIRGGSLAGLHLYDGPTWTPKSANPDATTGVAHILVHDPTGSAIGKFFQKQTFMYNKCIPLQIAIPPKPFLQCTRCHRLGHDISKCNRPANAQICHHCGSNNHSSGQHKYQCKEQHSGPTCDCPPRCFLCRNAGKSSSQFTGHTSIDSSCPLRRYTFVLSDPTNAVPPLTNV